MILTEARIEQELMRVRVLYFFMMAALLMLAVVLLREQVFHVSYYRHSSERQSLRRVRIPGERGRILDRNGVCVADNRPNYCIAIYTEMLREPGRIKNTVDSIEKIVARISAITGLPVLLSRQEIVDHLTRRRSLPLIAWRDVGLRAMARLEESQTELPGVDIYYEAARVYPNGAAGAHVLGYVGKASNRPEADEEEEIRYHFSMPEMDGQYGVEKAYDKILAGKPGGRLLRVDATGFRFGEQQEFPARPGADLVLTLDIRIQQLLEKALEDRKAAGVVLDPRNGDVLAMASMPAFDPNLFSPAISSKDLTRLQADERNPFLNRCIRGCYAPGSVFKPLVAITAMESGVVNENTPFPCVGYFEMGNLRIHCWQKAGHGPLAMQKALEQSCNAYFCQVGLACGIDRLRAMGSVVGLGKKTGIELEGEDAGLFPDEAWKKKTLREGWWPGDTANLSIGQGALLVTPLQMAVFDGAIANGGYVYQPRLVANTRRGQLVRKISWSSHTLQVVRNGMRDVIQSDTGTGKRARIAAVEMAGKTGTAEFGPKEERKKYTWMTVFAPYENPRYVVIMMVEEGDSGGITVAPRMRVFMEGVFALEKAAAKPANDKTEG